MCGRLLVQALSCRLPNRIADLSSVQAFSDVLQEFVNNARYFIFDAYCKIHQCMELQTLAKNFNMEHEEAEKWIVSLIRTSKLHNATIDSNEGTVIMGLNVQSPFDQLIEKVKGLSYRTSTVANAVTGVRRTPV